jgi:DNA-binding protein HU-beta
VRTAALEQAAVSTRELVRVVRAAQEQPRSFPPAPPPLTSARGALRLQIDLSQCCQEQSAMNKSELVQALSSKTELSRSDAQTAVDALFNPEDGLIMQALKAGDKVQITGFGTFETRQRKARTGRNPRTGTEIRIGPTISASFRPGKALKDAVRPA